MQHIAVIPGLITVSLFTVAALFLAWLSHRGDDRPKKKKRK